MYLIDCIVPYPNLLEAVTEVWAEHPYRDKVELRSHPKAVYEIPDYKLYGDIAIARGMSVQFLKSHYPEMPVIEIPMSVYDILMAFYDAQKSKPNHVALIGLPNATYGVDELGRSLFPKFSIYELQKDMDYGKTVRQAVEEGADYIVGGNAVVENARRAGIRCSLITTSKASVRQAIDEAISLLEFSAEQKARAGKLQTVLDNISEGVISIDSNKRITVFNSDACRFFGIRESYALGKSIDEILPVLDNPDISTMLGSTFGNVVRINDKDYSINKFPIRIDGNFSGAIMIFQQVNVIRDLETKIRQTSYSKGFVAKYGFDDIVGKSKPLVQAKELALKYSKVNSSILIVGETGTGKELFAQSIHKASDRRNGPFVAINCAALPENLLESELFGYAAGAFTGASKSGKVGLFELAHNGTIFLDEVSEMSLSLQGRLLRVLAEHSIMRLGDDSVIPVDVRIISATNRAIEDEVDAGRFRRDLFFRLNVLRIDVPPLRERGSDILMLAKFFLELYDRKLGSVAHEFAPDCYPYLLSYGYEGNVRELGNMCERLSVIIEEKEITLDDLVSLFGRIESGPEEDISEKKRIEKALESFRSKSDAAKYLNMDRSTLYRKMTKYGIPD
ncbi:MAG: sigma 54-interacting transcriptional regulator [Spirochaetales bacterium]|nr:sigma 54-interacting transcriptional regulator [Spirochaetales bacterium]